MTLPGKGIPIRVKRETPVTIPIEEPAVPVPEPVQEPEPVKA